MAERSGTAWRPSPLVVASAALHGVALTTMLAFPGSWRVMLAAVVSNHAVLTAAGMLPRCSWLGPNITRLPSARASEGLIALTFDDGPHPEVTPAVLELLDQAGARATFFCVGHRAEAHPEIVAAIRSRGHGVENHTYSHSNGFAFHGPGGLRREIQRAQKAIKRSGGGWPHFFRAPAGIQNPWLPVVLAGAGLSHVSWTRRGFDTVTSDSNRVAARLGRGLRGGDILLLHDASSARDTRQRPVVLDTLSQVLDVMARKGLRSEALHVALGREGQRSAGRRARSGVLAENTAGDPTPGVRKS
jgi:peptidoglycan/xylan/chitin deacetylase (PgdA/CDA1 family)